jgi:hypothetical protein
VCVHTHGFGRGCAHVCVLHSCICSPLCAHVCAHVCVRACVCGCVCGCVHACRVEAATVDMLLEQLMDLRNVCTRTAYQPKDAYDAALAAALEGGFPAHLSAFEAALHGDWLLGGSLCAADVVLYELVDQVRLMAPGYVEASYPKLTALLSRFEALPAIAAYQASPRFLRRPVNNTMASFK